MPVYSIRVSQCSLRWSPLGAMLPVEPRLGPSLSRRQTPLSFAAARRHQDIMARSCCG